MRQSLREELRGGSGPAGLILRLTACCVLLLPFSLLAQGGAKNVLFLGNSYTYANDLPQITVNLAQAAGDTLMVESNTPGGYTFQLHSTNATSLSMIQQGNWDFVVLQEQSQLPSFPPNQVQTQCFPFAALLDSMVSQYNSCGETMFFMTWGRKNGDAQNCPNWPPVCTYAGMDSLLRLRYQMMANDNQAVVSPVGAVWRYIRHHYPSIELYSSDESHPSEAGSYAAACAFYTAIFRKDPSAIPFDYTLTPPDAGAIRLAAKLVVYDSLWYWNIGKYDPAADFTYLDQGGGVFSFTNNSLYANHFLWDFGDGTTSTQPDPQHQYSLPGTYAVRLIASHCSMFDTLTQQIQVTSADIPSLTGEGNAWGFFPNPATETVRINCPSCRLEAAEVFIMSHCGSLLSRETMANGASVNLSLSGLSSGLYYIGLYRPGQGTDLKPLLLLTR
ncbi:MAG TPA: PKD domain-containing protein [Bacteroidales bacterium]|nr:PKD domain-containing protein [Bacteroidales bacterium]HSA42558.1 PKD domain-containing protein [Bacteroidales bacterium]